MSDRKMILEVFVSLFKHVAFFMKRRNCENKRIDYAVLDLVRRSKFFWGLEFF